MDTTIAKLESETERRLRERMEQDYQHAQEATAQYLKVVQVYITDPLVLNVIDSYSRAKAKEILALRSLEGCGWR